MPKIEQACGECGAPFLSWVSQHRRFCSQSCARRAQLRDPAQWQLRQGKMQRPRGKHEELVCARCGTTFERTRRRGNTRYCSMACYDAARHAERPTTCERCGTPLHKGLRYCSRACQALARTVAAVARTYNGKPVRIKRGYLYVYDPQHFVPGRDDWHLEHRYLIERMLGRPLRADEHVHHIDGDKANNDLSNLRVMDAHEHHLLSGNERAQRDREAYATAAALSEEAERMRTELAEYRRRFGALDTPAIDAGD